MIKKRHESKMSASTVSALNLNKEKINRKMKIKIQETATIKVKLPNKLIELLKITSEDCKISINSLIKVALSQFFNYKYFDEDIIISESRYGEKMATNKRLIELIKELIQLYACEYNDIRS